MQGAPIMTPETNDATRAQGAAGAVVETTTATFRQDVMTASMSQLVLVDFWAPWCGPCKQLEPVLHKVVEAAGAKVRLVKLNIDDHPQIPGQLGIQSIPAVIAFQRGQPVDGFMGVVPESQIRSFIEKLIGPIGPAPVEQMVAEAHELAEAGDAEAASQLFLAVLAQEPVHMGALAGLAKLHLVNGDLEGARAVLAQVPEDKRQDPAVSGVQAAIDLADQSAKLGDVSEIEARVLANPNDHQARFDLALALAAHGDGERATDELIEIIQRDRAWNDDGARRQLLLFFEAWGPMDDLSKAGRRKLSTVLFR
jgi:putative thioredoxin